MIGYEGVNTAVGLIDRSARVRLAVSGADRAKFLHNLTTNEVKRLPEGRGCEAFVTSPQGKTLGFVSLLACPGQILLRTDPGGDVLLRPHLEKYGVFDEVSLDDIAGSTFELHLAGPRTEELLQRLGLELPGLADLDHTETVLDGRSVRVVRESPTGRPGMTLLGARGDQDAIRRQIQAAGLDVGLVEVGDEEFEALRIEAGTPVFGRDVSEKNLPQEIGRDDRAISFVKGCYLGQETVARIDAVGHVNQILRGLLLEPGAAAPPAAGSVEVDGKSVGRLTSAAFSPGWNAWIGLAYVRINQMAAGTQVRLSGAGANSVIEVPAVVVDLPAIPPVMPSPTPAAS
jgi:folate-binding protein YgfZ